MCRRNSGDVVIISRVVVRGNRKNGDRGVGEENGRERNDEGAVLLYEVQVVIPMILV